MEGWRERKGIGEYKETDGRWRRRDAGGRKRVRERWEKEGRKVGMKGSRGRKG